MRIRLVAVAVAGLLLPAAAATASAGSVSNRQSRTSHVAVAGADVLLWSTHRSDRDNAACSLSFAVRARNGHRGVLTAGHCVRLLPGPAPYTVHQTRQVGGSGTDPGDRLGTVTAGRYYMGRAGDSAFIRLASGRHARSSVFVGGPSTSETIPVVGARAPASGLHVCYSGARTGEHCGFVVGRRPHTVDFQAAGHGDRFIRIHHVWRARSAHCPAKSGDSGAAVYVKRAGRAYAVGTLTGGGSAHGGCPLLFTSLRRTLRTMHLRLLTAR